MDSTNGDGTEDGLAMLFGAPAPSDAAPAPSNAAPAAGERELTRRERRAREEAEARGAAVTEPASAFAPPASVFAPPAAPSTTASPPSPVNPVWPAPGEVSVAPTKALAAPPAAPVNPAWPAPGSTAERAPLPEPWPMPPPSGSMPVALASYAPGGPGAPASPAAPFPRPDLVAPSAPTPVPPPVTASPPPVAAPPSIAAPSADLPMTPPPADPPLLASYFAAAPVEPVGIAEPRSAPGSLAERPDTLRPDPSGPDAFRPNPSGPDMFRPDPSGPDAFRPNPSGTDPSGPDRPRPGQPLLPSNEPPPPAIEEIERSTTGERLGLIFSFLLPPIGLVLGIAHAIRSRRRRGWVTGLVRGSVVVGVVFTLLAGLGGAVLGEQRAQALRYDELRQASTVFCGAVATQPDLIALPTFGWPAPAPTIPESIAAMQGYAARWAVLVDDVPAEIRGEVLTLAGTASRIAAAVAVARTVDDVQNQAVIGSLATRSALPAWHTEYCVTD